MQWRWWLSDVVWMQCSSRFQHILIQNFLKCFLAKERHWGAGCKNAPTHLPSRLSWSNWSLFQPKKAPSESWHWYFLHFPHFAIFCDISPQSTFGNIQQLRTNIFCSESFLLECFYLFVKDICLLQFGRPPDSKLDLVCSNCLVLFCRILLELQHQTTSSHSSVRNTIFILFTRSDFFISFVYYECDFYMRKPTVEKFCNVSGKVQNFETLCLFCVCSVIVKGAKLPDLHTV